MSSRLALHHYEELHEGSGISQEVIEARGAYTETSPARLRALGFADYQALAPALVLPVHSLNGWERIYYIKPDRPRIPAGKAKPLKYEYPAGAPNRLDVPANTAAVADDPSIPVMLTEGVKKVDKATSAGYHCIGLGGIWNWLGRHDTPFGLPIPDFGYFAWKGRTVAIVFDSDVAVNKNVREARRRLKLFLESLGAVVVFIDLAPCADGSKVGLDDYLLTHPDARLWDLAYAPDDAEAVRLREQVQADQQARLQLQRRESAMARLAANKHTRKFLPVAIRTAAELDLVKAKKKPTERGDYRISHSRVRGIEYDEYGAPRPDVAPICSEGTVSSHLDEIGKIVPEFHVDKRPGTVTLTRKDRHTGEKIKQEIPSTLTYVKWDGSSTDLLNALASYRTEEPERRGGKRCPDCGSQRIKPTKWACQDCGSTFGQPAEQVATTEPLPDPDPATTQAWNDLYRRAESRAAKFAAGGTQAEGTESPLIPLAINFAAGAQEPPPLPEGYFDSLIDPQANFAAGEPVRCTFTPYGCDCPHPVRCAGAGKCSP